MENKSNPAAAARLVLDNKDIVKGPTDHRSYRIVELANGLRCVLVHEANATQSSAAVGVAVGHFHDPNHAQGLAHFLEHMLFLGTEKYPEAESYQRFISQHGGYHNAWTGTEFSNYYFSIDSPYFQAALDRFLHFFYEPLIADHWVEKELQAIEAEFHLKRQDELRRLYQVHKATSNSKHPFSKFSVGNLNTLMHQPDKSLAVQLREFFNRWYSAPRMTLVLMGPESLLQLEQLAIQYASAIPADSRENFYIDEPLYTPEQLGIQLRVKPLKKARRLLLSFAFPSIDDDYANKNTSYLAHLLGYEGPNSLFAYLREQNWINSLSAGGGISGSNFKDFNINIQLTKYGIEHVDDVVEAVFAYIHTIRTEGLNEWRYNERKVSVMNAFNYQDAINSIDLAPQLAINLHHYCAEDVVFGDYRMDGLYLPKVTSFLDCMVPSNMRLTLIHQQQETDQIEPIYRTEYGVSPLTAAQLKRFNQPRPIPAQLPLPNPFLQQPWELQPAPKSNQSTPSMHEIQPAIHHWHLHDGQFRQPKAHVYCGFYLPKVIESPGQFASARLWCELMLDTLNEQFYDAEIAGLNFNLYPQQQGITLHVSGAAMHLPTLTQEMLALMQTAQFSKQRWENLRQRLITNWQQALLHKPLNLLFSNLNVHLQPHTYSVIDLAATLEQLDFETFQASSVSIFEQGSIELFSHGDFNRDALQAVTSTLEAWPKLNHSFTKADLTPRPLCNAIQDQPLRTKHTDHAVIAVLQSQDNSPRSQALFMLLQHFISPRIFNELRTQKQLGYLVGSSYMPMQQYPHLLLYVQSSRYPYQHLETALVEYLQHFQVQLAQIDHEEFAKAQQTLTQQLCEPDSSLRARSQRLWSSITQQDHDFSRLSLIAQELRSFGLEQIKALTQQIINSNSSHMFLATCPANFDSSQ